MASIHEEWCTYLIGGECGCGNQSVSWRSVADFIEDEDIAIAVGQLYANGTLDERRKHPRPRQESVQTAKGRA